MIKITFEPPHEKVMSVPYPTPTNATPFVDLRDEPVLAKKIGEAEGGASFGRLLESIAISPQWMSIGTGVITTHVDGREDHMGYVQFCSRDYQQMTPERYQKVCEQIAFHMRAAPLSEIRFTLGGCGFHLAPQDRGIVRPVPVVYWYAPKRIQIYEGANLMAGFF